MNSKNPAAIFHPSEFPSFLKARMMQDSVAEFAAKLGVTPKHVYMMLAGNRQPGSPILKKLGLEIYYVVPPKESK